MINSMENYSCTKHRHTIYGKCRRREANYAMVKYYYKGGQDRMYKGSIKQVAAEVDYIKY